MARHGRIALIEERCTSCDVCARECPVWCIRLTSHTERDTSTATGRGRARAYQVLDTFDIDYGLCLYCGICVDVCPFDALAWVADVATASADRTGLVADREALAP